MNALFPGANLRVGEISESVNKGRHTTVGARMLPLPGGEGGYVIDTPGLREVGLWALLDASLDQCFPELRALRDGVALPTAATCPSRSARCATPLRAGRVERDRYDSYLRMLEELGEAR